MIGIQKVDSDEEALQLMNDSPYGLVSLDQLRDLDDCSDATFSTSSVDRLGVDEH